jgi:hypothetical protein
VTSWFLTFCFLTFNLYRYASDDLGFKLEYHHPYCLGDGDPDKTMFKTSVFNSRKLSPVFTGWGCTRLIQLTHSLKAPGFSP